MTLDLLTQLHKLALFQNLRGKAFALLTAGLVLLLVGVLASLIPARRAAALDPVTVLREE